jgi:hypothetical protein
MQAEIEAVRTELLALTDGRIHAKTALRDELARRVAALEDEVQQEDETAEDDQVRLWLCVVCRARPVRHGVLTDGAALHCCTHAYISSLQAYISQLSLTVA